MSRNRIVTSRRRYVAQLVVGSESRIARAPAVSRARLVGAVLGAGLVVLGGLTAAFSPALGASRLAHGQRAQRAYAQDGWIATTGRRRPNIVFVLTDDLSMDLVRYMPQVRALEHRGLTFTNYFVADSLCCPSRASIFTGNFPHDTGVFENLGPQGGFGAFHVRGDERKAFNVALQRAGYRTAMMGKYLNGYLYNEGAAPVARNYVPPGWNEWDVAGWGYPEYNYDLNHDGTIRHYGNKPRDYLTDVLARDGVRFIDESAGSGQPFFLELAPFAPHDPYTPAPRYAHAFPGLSAPRPLSFNALPSDAPRWLSDHPRLTAPQLGQIDDAFRKRVQAVQSVDDLVAKVERVLAAHGMLRDTYVVFSSDNGLHTGEYRLMPGKLTAFDTDIHVPLVIAGPCIRAGARSDAMAESVDLADTFATLAGTTMSTDGHSLVPLLGGGRPAGWRDAILVEHQGPAANKADPDRQTAVTGDPPSYEAIRKPGFLYVEYRGDEREFYDLAADPFELHNVIATLGKTQLAHLHNELVALDHCHSGPRCWSAEHVDDATVPNRTTKPDACGPGCPQRSTAESWRRGVSKPATPGRGG